MYQKLQIILIYLVGEDEMVQDLSKMYVKIEIVHLVIMTEFVVFVL